MKKILVTGSNSQIGMELRERSERFKGFQFDFQTHQTLPIDDFEGLKNYFSGAGMDYCINTAAYTMVDKADSEPELALQINAVSVGKLARICAENHSKFIHISSDYVFDGRADKPYNEEDQPNPVNLYGMSKWEGEKEALANNPDSLVLRTSWVYSRHGKNFVKTMIRYMGERPEVRVVNDQVGSPTWAGDIADVVMNIIGSDHWVPGIFHFSNEGFVSWYDFAVKIHDLIGSDCRVVSIPSSEFPSPITRPERTCLSKKKIMETYGVHLVPWELSLSRCLSQILPELGKES